MATKFPRRAKQSKHARRNAPTAKRRARPDVLNPYVIAPRKQNKKTAGLMIADPHKLKDPPLTADRARAHVFANRGGAHKFILRNPHLRKKYWYRRVA